MNAPRVLKCCYFRLPAPSVNLERRVRDYEFDYYLSGGRTVWVDGVTHEVEPGTLLIRRPGQLVSGSGPYDCYMLTLDFSGSTGADAYDRNRPGPQQPISHSELLSQLPPWMVPRHGGEYRELLQLIAMAASQHQQTAQVDALVMEFLHLVASDAYRIRLPGPAGESMADICLYMQEHFQDDLTLDELAGLLHFNKSYFTRKFRSQIGVSPMQYLLHIRLENAKLLLSNTACSVSEVAQRCGFCDCAYFGYHFKRACALTPLQYRNKHKA